MSDSRKNPSDNQDDSGSAASRCYALTDVNGRECRPGDLIRVYHYRDRSSGRKCYMWKLVVLCDDDLKVSKCGKWLFAVDVHDIWKRVDLMTAHKARLDLCGPFEIVSGLSQMTDGNLQTWYERPKSDERQR